MLRKAHDRVAEHRLTNVEALAVMDAGRMALPDRSFDVVVAQFVITAVPNPEATLDEFARVIRPGGEIVLVNHIGAEAGPRRVFELCFAPIARRLGWRPEFRFGRLADLGRGPWCHTTYRAPADAAAWPLFTDPLSSGWPTNAVMELPLPPGRYLFALQVHARNEERAMVRKIHIFGLTVLALLLPALALGPGAAAEQNADCTQDRAA